MMWEKLAQPDYFTENSPASDMHGTLNPTNERHDILNHVKYGAGTGGNNKLKKIIRDTILPASRHRI